jgi:hypothetical protein
MTTIEHGNEPGNDAPIKKAAGALTLTATAHLATESIARAKRLSTVTARCALAGITLSPIEDDHGKTVYIVSRLALTHELAALGAVECWLDDVTGGTS